VSYHIKQWQDKVELKNQNIFGVKNQKRNEKSKSNVYTGFVFSISFLIFNSENISFFSSNLSCDWLSVSVEQGDVSIA
jgi:hypothetical protein